MRKKENLRNLPFPQLQELVEEMGQPKYRARQIWTWLYHRHCRSIGEMTDLPKNFRETLDASHTAEGLKIAKKRKSGDGTVKYLFELSDGLTVETVFIPDGKRGTVCLSSQVGCKFGCRFCATGADGFQRNLTLAEILCQIIEVGLDGDAGKITNVVFMGMGEPLDNFDAVVNAVRIINSPDGFGIGVRHITLSTAGLVNRIRELGALGLNMNLAVSLHSADDAIRESLMPLNKSYGVMELMHTLSEYPLQKGREITIEMILFNGINDSKNHAAKLIKALHGVKAKVNLITFNPVSTKELTPSPKEKVAAFQERLLASHIPTTIRKSRGGDIEAACGQLRYVSDKKNSSTVAEAVY